MIQYVQRTAGGFTGRCGCIWATWEFPTADEAFAALETHTSAGHKNGSRRAS